MDGTDISGHPLVEDGIRPYIKAIYVEDDNGDLKWNLYKINSANVTTDNITIEKSSSNLALKIKDGGVNDDKIGDREITYTSTDNITSTTGSFTTLLNKIAGNIKYLFSNMALKNNILAATKTKITYNNQGVITSGEDIGPTDIKSIDAIDGKKVIGFENGATVASLMNMEGGVKTIITTSSNEYPTNAEISSLRPNEVAMICMDPTWYFTGMFYRN